MTTSTKYLYYDFENAYMKASADGFYIKLDGNSERKIDSKTNLAMEVFTRGKSITEEEYENA